MCRKSSEKGFSYVDVMIGIVILMIGIVASAGALTANLVRSYETEKQIKAKQIALSTIEAIFATRDITRPGVVEGWNAIGNGSANPPNGTNIFLTGFRPLRQDAGWDGVIGTVDDACDAGAPCQVANRPDNTSEVIEGFERQIVITDIEDPDRPSPAHKIAARRISVSVRYNINQLQRQQTVSTIITNYSE